MPVFNDPFGVIIIPNRDSMTPFRLSATAYIKALKECANIPRITHQAQHRAGGPDQGFNCAAIYTAGTFVFSRKYEIRHRVQLSLPPISG